MQEQHAVLDFARSLDVAQTPRWRTLWPPRLAQNETAQLAGVRDYNRRETRANDVSHESFDIPGLCLAMLPATKVVHRLRVFSATPPENPGFRLWEEGRLHC